MIVMGSGKHRTFGQKIEAILFPLAAAVVGIGYSIAILVNNPLETVLVSPHAIVLLIVLIGIAFFPLRSLYRILADDGGETAGKKRE